MTDRELLEMAAKAAGIKVKGIYEDEDTLQIKPGPGMPPARWNPLADDGDALRLMTVLRLEPVWLYANEEVVVDYAADDLESVREIYDEYSEDGKPQPDNRGPALRRAIVRAAAEIGKAMP